ncbi:MAG: DUF4270 family protein [Bacteroidota bacterium]
MFKCKRVFLYLILITPILFFGCENEENTIGVDLDSSPINTIFIDTLTVVSSTIILDSIPTSSSESILVGRHIDEDLGAIEAIGYFQPGTSALIEINESTAEFDSITLVLSYNYWYYDTSSMQTINVHRLAEDMQLEDDGFLYNTSHFEIDPQAIGTVQFKPRPNRRDSVEITLDEQVGREIFDLASNQASELRSNGLFVDYFKGLAIKPSSSDNSAILGFSRNTKMKLYYHFNNGSEIEEVVIDFPIGQNLIFNQVITDRSLTKFPAELRQRDKLISTTLDNRAYIQASTGIATRLEFPTLDALNEVNDNIIINSAFLELSPVLNSFSDTKPLTDSLAIFRTNGINALQGQLNTSIQLIVDDEFRRDTKYIIDLTAYVTEEVSDPEFSNDGLLILLDQLEYVSTLNRIYFRDANNDMGIKLNVYFSTVD